MPNSSVFNDISDDLEFLSNVSNDPMSIVRKAGEAVITAGETGNFMYVVKSGVVEIFRGGVTPERVTADGTVGEMALVDKGQRSADVIAVEDSELIPIGRSRFQHLVGKNPEFTLLVMTTMIRRLREAAQRLQGGSERHRRRQSFRYSFAEPPVFVRPRARAAPALSPMRAMALQ